MAGVLKVSLMQIPVDCPSYSSHLKTFTGCLCCATALVTMGGKGNNSGPEFNIKQENTKVSVKTARAYH